MADPPFSSLSSTFCPSSPPDEHAHGRPVASRPQDRLNSPSGARVSSEARGPIHCSRVSAPFAELASPHHTCAYVDLGKIREGDDSWDTRATTSPQCAPATLCLAPPGLCGTPPSHALVLLATACSHHLAHSGIKARNEKGRRKG